MVIFMVMFTNLHNHYLNYTEIYKQIATYMGKKGDPEKWINQLIPWPEEGWDLKQR